MKYVLDMRADPVGGAVVRGVLTNDDTGISGAMAENELVTALGVTFLVHGFNVNRVEGKLRQLELAAALEHATSGALIVALWPGDHWIGPLSYSFEGRDANDTALELVRFIELAILPGTPLSFVSHSLGARVVMETIERLGAADYPISQVCLMAPAIDDFSLASMQDYLLVAQRADRVAVLSSKADKVLKYAYPAGDLLQAFFFADDELGLALGYHGPRPSDAGAAVPANVFDERIDKRRESGHGHYVPDPRIQGDPERRRNQDSAANYAGQVLGGDSNPQYR